MVDLHIHTSRSDGALSPFEVVDLAVRKKLEAIAITDHDTVAGNEEAVSHGADQGLPVVQGVEISTHFSGITFHLLGYGVRSLTPQVQECFAFLDESRKNRNPRMVRKLRDLGVDITMGDVVAGLEPLL